MAKSAGDDRRVGKPGRIARAKSHVASRPWGVIVAANALPVMVALVVGVLWAKGSIEFAPGSVRVLPRLVVLGVTLAILGVIAWIIAPAVFGLGKRVRAFMIREVALMKSGSLLMVPFRAVLVLGGMAAYGVVWANLIVLGLLALVDVAAIIVSLVAFAQDVLSTGG